MNMKKSTSLLYIAFIILLSSCSLDVLSPDGIDFSINDFGEVTSSAKITSEKFNSNVVGYGWKCVDFRYVKDNGTLATQKESYQDGWGPSDYYFDESTVTSFFDVTAFFTSFYSINSYRFEDSTIHIGSNNDLRLLKLSGDTFTFVSRIGEASTPRYMYFKYKKMTDKELKDYKNKYATDYASYFNNRDSQ